VLGAQAQTVEVKSAVEMINTSSADVSHTMNQRYYQDLPVVMGADIRLAESMLIAQPGYTPMAPNGANMFRGSQFQSRINGGQTMATENWMDGAAFGYAFGHGQTQESAPPYEAIREMRVVNSSFSAQYGHTSGAFIEYTSKSGSNDFHGSVYEYVNNDILNACSFYCPPRFDASGNKTPGKSPAKLNDYGFTAGGPIRKNKTHFFTNLALMKMRQQVGGGFPHTVPTPLFKGGNFSEILGPQIFVKDAQGNNTNVPVLDALNRPIFEGQIYNPSTSRLVGGIQTRDAFGFDPVTGLPIAGQANIITDPVSSVTGVIIPLIPPQERAGTSLNYVGGFADTTVIDVKTWSLRIDHSFTPNLKSASSFWMNERPRNAPCDNVQRCEVAHKYSDFDQNSSYIGGGFLQRIANRFMHQQFDWIIKPNVFNHTTISYDRWYMGGSGLSAGVGWFSKLGLTGLPAIYDEQTAFPAVNFGGGVLPMSNYGNSWQRGFQAVNRWQFLDDLTWIHGRHTIKMGYEYRWHEFNLAGWGRAIGGQWNFDARETRGYDAAGNPMQSTGHPFASFYLGEIDNASFPIQIDPSFVEGYTAPWVNDEIKVTDKLTINFGLRFDYQMARRERHDRYSTFDPNLPNPGAGNLPGAMAFASASNRTFENPKKDGWGPRFGFAYRLSDKNVVRGGYGIYYAGVMFDNWISYPSTGYETFNTAPNVTNGFTPAFNWDNGFPQQFVKQPPQIDPTVANGTGPLAVASDGIDLPRYQNWSLTWERQLSPNLLLDVSYVANHATRLVSNRQVLGFPFDNMNHPSVLSLGAAALTRDIADPLSQALPEVLSMPLDANNVHRPFAGFSGSVAQALRPFPQYQEIQWRNTNQGSSIYHSLQMKLDRRFSNGLQFRFAYVWSKLIVGTVSETGNGNECYGCGVQNPIDTRQAERSLSADDVPHTFIATYVYDLPFGHGKKFGQNAGGVVNKIIGGWALSGIQRYDSGRPVRITMNNDMGGLLFTGSKKPNKLGGGCWGGGHFDPNADRQLSSSGWADPGPLTFGNAGRYDPECRRFAVLNEDLSIRKDTFFRGERLRVRFEAQLGNIFNRVFWCLPETNFSSPDFGRVFSQCNIPRKIQFGLRVDF
jgi:hypothetical protein